MTYRVSLLVRNGKPCSVISWYCLRRSSLSLKVEADPKDTHSWELLVHGAPLQQILPGINLSSTICDHHRLLCIPTSPCHISATVMGGFVLVTKLAEQSQACLGLWSNGRNCAKSDVQGMTTNHNWRKWRPFHGSRWQRNLNSLNSSQPLPSVIVHCLSAIISFLCFCAWSTSFSSINEHIRWPNVLYIKDNLVDYFCSNVSIIIMLKISHFGQYTVRVLYLPRICTLLWHLYKIFVLYSYAFKTVILVVFFSLWSWNTG